MDSLILVATFEPRSRSCSSTYGCLLAQRNHSPIISGWAGEAAHSCHIRFMYTYRTGRAATSRARLAKDLVRRATVWSYTRAKILIAYQCRLISRYFFGSQVVVVDFVVKANLLDKRLTDCLVGSYHLGPHVSRLHRSLLACASRCTGLLKFRKATKLKQWSKLLLPMSPRFKFY